MRWCVLLVAGAWEPAGGSALSGAADGAKVVWDMAFGGAAAAPPAPRAELTVFVAGFGRSGTASMAAALRTLGFPCGHGPDLLIPLQDATRQFYAGEISGTDLLHRVEDLGYAAGGLDMLGFKLYAEAAAMGAKVIYLRRDPAKWARSWRATVGTHFPCFASPPFTYMPLFQKIDPYLRDALEQVSAGHPEDAQNEVHLREGHAQLERRILEAVPGALVYSVEEGWPPLCRFLEVKDCPTTPFPFVNDRTTMEAIGYVFWALVCLWPWLPVVGVFVVAKFATRRKAKTA